MSESLHLAANRRRAPTHLSTSLCHDNLRDCTNCGRHVDAQHGQIVDVRCQSSSEIPVSLAEQPSNGSDESEGSSARKWFDWSNNCPVAVNDLSFEDNEPPFFQPQDSSDSSNVIGSKRLNYRSLHTRKPTVVSSVTNDSDSNDYRSVIDDLTIENRKLKERLRKYEEALYSTLEEDRLFEVKIHTLPAHKKRELDEILQLFVTNLDGSNSASSASKNPQKAAQLQSSSTFKAGSGSKNTSNSYTPNLGPINSDSAYASISCSGPNSSSMDYVTLNDINSRNIPEGLLPSHPSTITEKQKKKEVVRRLEQLFTGKTNAVVGGHGQSRQLQEVSNSAARVDRVAKKAPALIEGIREAHILQEMEVDITELADIVQESVNGSSSRDQSDSALCTALFASPEQRPTRPLDLDPDRQQIPSDNVQYIRHLGLSTPKLITENSSDVELDAEGWIYLNLLVNMAQLHLLNVTLDFVRLAVSEVSEKFQLSKDGRKIRWRGTEGPRLNSRKSESEDIPHNDSSLDSVSLDEHCRKKRKINLRLGRDIGQARSSTYPVRARHPNELNGTFQQNAFHYKPLGIFSHQISSQEDLISLDEISSCNTYDSGAGGVARRHQAWGELAWPGVSGRKSRDHNSIIFYSGAPFCVDLIGDPENLPTQHTIDRRQTILGCDHVATHSMGRNFLQSAHPKTPRPLSNGGSMNLDFSPSWASSDSGEFNRLQEFPASGLGGTQPADHFAIRVKTRRTKLGKSSQAKLGTSFSAWSQKPPHKTKISSIKSFEASQDQAETIISQLSGLRTASLQAHIASFEDMPVKTEIISATVPHQLRPSALPAPMYLGVLAECEDDSECSSSQSCSDIPRLCHGPYLQMPFASMPSDMPQSKDALDESTSDVEGVDNEGENEGADDDDSIEILVHAREVEPDTIAATEQEFESEVGRWVFEEPPAGSSAAAIDGIGGFRTEK